MYGLVNKAVRDLIVEKFGHEKWETIRLKAGVKEEKFTAMQTYPDSVTYDLVKSAAEELKTTPHQVLQSFGQYWTLFTAQEGYGELMDMFGSDFFDAIRNLNSLHSRIGHTLSHLKPPKFNCTDLSSNTVMLEYISEREGLAPMVIGLLEGLAEKHKVKIKIEHCPKTENERDKFKIEIISKL